MAGMTERIGQFSLSREEFIFFVVLALNALVVAAYWLVSHFWKKDRRGSVGLRCVVMLLCPVVGECFFLFSWGFYRLFLHSPVNLADVIFSKERVKTYMKADEGKESNFVPLEEAITVTDKESTRTLMMEVVRRDVSRSLSTIALALNSEDSEVSHYAASVLQETMDKLRLDFQRRYREVMDTEAELAGLDAGSAPLRTETGAAAAAAALENATQTHDVELYREDTVRARTAREALAQALLASGEDEMEQIEDIQARLREEIEQARSLMDDVYQVLRQQVFSSLEQTSYTQMLGELAHIVDRRDMLTSYELEMVTLQELSMGNYEECAQWCERAARLYPDALSTYTCGLKLAFAKGDRETFFRTLDELKKADITIDHETLELVRAFSDSNRAERVAAPETA